MCLSVKTNTMQTKTVVEFLLDLPVVLIAAAVVVVDVAAVDFEVGKPLPSPCLLRSAMRSFS